MSKIRSCSFCAERRGKVPPNPSSAEESAPAELGFGGTNQHRQNMSEKIGGKPQYSRNRSTFEVYLSNQPGHSAAKNPSIFSCMIATKQTQSMIVMQRLIYVLAFLPLSLSLVFSQEVSVRFSEELSPGNMQFGGCLSAYKSSYYAFFMEHSWHNEAAITINKFDASLKLEGSKAYKSGKEDSNTAAVKQSKGKMAWVVTKQSKGEDNLVCYMATGDIDGEMGELEYLFETPSRRVLLPTKVEWMVFPDSNRHVVYALSDREDDKNKPLANLVIMDSRFNKLWSKRFEMGYSERRLKALSWAALTNGDVCMLAKIYGNDKYGEAVKRDGERVPDYKLVIFQFSKNEDKPKEYEMKLGDLFVNGPAIFANLQNELTCAGFFAKSHTGNSVGMFHLKLNTANGEVMAMKKHDFNDRDIKAIGENVASKDKEGYWGIESTFNFVIVHPKSDGGTLLLAEDIHNSLEKGMGASTGPSTASKQVYYKNEVAIFQIDNLGETSLFALLPKKQAMTSYLFESFFSMKTEGKTYIIYNDNEGNLERENGEKIKVMEDLRKCVPVVALLEDDGSLKRKILFDPKEAEGFLMPPLCVQTNSCQLLFPAYKPGMSANFGLKLGLITFPD